MKKFLLLWALALACALPFTAEADVTVTATGGDLGTDINNALDALVTARTPPTATDVIAVTVPSGITATANNINIPYSYEYVSDSTTTPVTTTTVALTTLSITGPGTVTIPSGGINRLFTVATDGVATFQGSVTLRGSNSSTTVGGGVIVTGGQATFNNVTFQGNNQSSGGALEISGGAVTLGGTIAFNSNYATTNGGAVNITGGSVTFSAAPTFDSNMATAGVGGAICVTTKDQLPSSGTFRGNTAASGGAIYVTTDTETLTLGSGMVFTDNYASGSSGGGGAVYYAGPVTVSGATFSSTLTTNATNGGAIYATNVTVNSSSSSFTSNKATSGGAIFATGNVTISDGTFTSNSATDGGVIYANSTAATTTISGGTFNGNTATTDGGVIYTVGTVTISGGTFGGSAANTAVNGGVARAATVNVNGGTFTGNTASGNGGALYATGTATIDGGTFTGNTATGDGGAIYAATVTHTGTVGGVFGTSGSSNQAVNGGAIYSTGTIDLAGTIFFNNKATGGNPSEGGATYSNDKSTFTNCFFDSNNAGTNGGASYAASIAVSNTTYINNGSNQYGGAIRVTGAGNTVTNSIFESNQAASLGGAIILGGTGASARIEGSIFRANIVAGTTVVGGTRYGGGAIAALGADSLLLLRCTFDYNEATGSNSQGGAASIAATTCNIVNCTFYENRTNGSGGALYLNSAVTGGAVVYNTFAKNTSGSGHEGNAIWSEAAFQMGANILAQTSTTSGPDLYTSDVGGTISSLGYNLVGVYGEGANSNLDVTLAGKFTPGTGDSFSTSNTFELFFGSESSTGLADNSGPTVGCSLSLSDSYYTQPTYSILRTLALQSSSGNPALAAINVNAAGIILLAAGADIPRTDERGDGFERTTGDGALWAIGAYDDHTGSGGSSGGGGGSLANLSKIEISQLPNTLRTVGHTASLFVRGFDVHGDLISGNLSGVIWASSAPSVARIDQQSNVFVYRIGTTVISATYGTLTDSVTLPVTEGMSYTNVHEGVWNQLGIYDGTLTSLSFADADPALVNAAAFQSAFRNIWHTGANQVVEISEAAASFTAPQRSGSVRPGIGFSLSNRSEGDVLPLKYQWSYTWDELSSLLGHTVSSVEQVNLSSLKIDFEASDGVPVPVIGTAEATVAGISAGDAGSSLELQPASGGATFNLTAYLANVQSSGENDGPQFVEGLLIVPDGVADTALSGTMWTTVEGSGGGGGGGGGCDAAGLGLLSLLLIPALIVRKR